MSDLKTLLKHFYEVSYIPVTLYSEGNKIVSYPVAKFEPNPASRYVKAIFDESNSWDATISNDFIISGFIQDKISGEVIIVGPITEYPFKKQTAYKMLKEFGEPLSRANELMSYFEMIPCMTLSNLLKHMVFLNYIINNEEHPSESFINEKLSQYSKIKFNQDIKDQILLHNSAEVEQYLLSCIEFGKTSELIQLLNNEKNMSANMGITANDSIRAYKNIFVTSAAIASRVAVRGGMSYETAMNMSDRYLRRMEALNNYNDIHDLWKQMLLDYTEHSEKCRHLNAHSKLVRNVCNYVMEHRFEKITATEIATSIGLNRSYLCRQFKQDTNKNLSEYINETKVDEAKRLLQFSNKEIVEIAEALGFSSQNYFQTIFKKVTGITPLFYRNQTR